MLWRIPALLALGFACGYGIRQLRGGYRRKYFTVALCGMIALLLSGLYELALALSSGVSALTVGTLGQASVDLFFTTANISFLAHKFAERMKTKLCVPAAMAVALLALVLAATALRGGAADRIAAVIGFIGMGNALYTAVCVLACRREFAVCGYVAPFNRCVCVLIGLRALQAAALAFFGGVWAEAVPALLGVPVLALMLPLLKKGMRGWTQ